MAPYHSAHCQFGTSSDAHWVKKKKKKWAWCQVAYVQIPAPSFTTCGTMAKLFEIAKLPHVLIGDSTYLTEKF